MSSSYSIADARNHLARLVHDVERGLPVELTRRGKRVAVLLSADQYDQAVQGKRSFWDALTAYRKKADLDRLNADEAYNDVRDKGYQYSFGTDAPCAEPAHNGADAKT